MSAKNAEAEDIVKSIHNSYGDLAASEVLTRALVAERGQDRDKALFWVQIYLALTTFEANTPAM